MVLIADKWWSVGSILSDIIDTKNVVVSVYFWTGSPPEDPVIAKEKTSAKTLSCLKEFTCCLVVFVKELCPNYHCLVIFFDFKLLHKELVFYIFIVPEDVDLRRVFAVNEEV